MTQPTPIVPTPPDAARRALLDRVLGTRQRDLASIESAHRELLACDPVLYQRFLAWTFARDPESRHLSVGVALLATRADPQCRVSAKRLLEKGSTRMVASVVDYIHGRIEDQLHLRKERKRFLDEMTEAYAAGAELLRETVEHGAGLDSADVLVTLGTYDKVQQVLDHLEVPYGTLPCKRVRSLSLRADQTLIVNCPGEFEDDDIRVIERFVACGGTLVTTDWALQTTIERAFPKTLAYNGKATTDDVVKVSWIDPESRYTRGVEVPGHELQWWLEASSYPIEVIHPSAKVLVASDEMKQKYGSSALVACFAWGEGMVFHLTSHYYLQRSKGDKSARENTVADAVGARASSEKVAHVDSASLAAAFSSLRLLHNILHERWRQQGAVAPTRAGAP